MTVSYFNYTDTADATELSQMFRPKASENFSHFAGGTDTRHALVSSQYIGMQLIHRYAAHT